ncbi:MAG: hypothetical protein JRH15_13555 [Deltaproteobacteria bacterium]|nr:hypothetical protein [Deltaproteobacteria bacterium]
MTKIQKVVRDIQNLQDFYKKTKLLRDRIKKKDLERSKAEQASAPGAKSHGTGGECVSPLSSGVRTGTKPPDPI